MNEICFSNYKDSSMRTITLLFCLFTISSLAQTGPVTPYEKEVDEQAQLIKKYFNTKQVDSLYALMAASFKAQVKKEALEQGMITQLAPYGIITAFDFVSSKGGINKYKTKLHAGLVLQTLVGLDSTGLVSTFAMQPYKDDAAPKRATLYSDNPMATRLDSMVDKITRNYMMDSLTAGLSIALHWKGKDFFYNYGEADKVKNIKTTRQSTYEIGSITKTFVGYLLAKAVGEKKIILSDPITNYLPDSVAENEAMRKIKIVDLANHTSGLPRLPVDLYNSPGIKNADPYAHYTDAMLYKGLTQIKPTRGPGEQYEYSNYAFGILGTILGRVYKMSFAQLADQKIFQPMKMKNTTAGNDLPENMALGYNEKGVATDYWKFQSMAAIGSIKSNANDLLQYGKVNMELMASKKPEAILLTTPTWNKPPSVVSLGWHLTPENESPAILQHGGGTYGFRSHLAICPDQKWVVVTLANHGIDPGASGVAIQISEQLKQLENSH
jgi:CubicO group peptidase (beta-lactamase class C family)